MGPFSLWDLLWVVLIAANVWLWVLSRRYLKAAVKDLDEAIETHKGSEDLLDEVQARNRETKRLLHRAKALLHPTTPLEAPQADDNKEQTP